MAILTNLGPPSFPLDLSWLIRVSPNKTAFHFIIFSPKLLSILRKEIIVVVYTTYFQSVT